MTTDYIINKAIDGLYILAWFIGAGLVSAFILHFKPTRKLIKKYLPFLLTND